MTIISEALVSHLQADATLTNACRWIYPEGASPQDRRAPFMTYEVTSEERDPLLDGQGTYKKARVFIDCYHADLSEAVAIAKLVEARMIDFRGTFGSTTPTVTADHIRLEDRFELYDDDVELFRVNADFLIGYRGG